MVSVTKGVSIVVLGLILVSVGIVLFPGAPGCRYCGQVYTSTFVQNSTFPLTATLLGLAIIFYGSYSLGKDRRLGQVNPPALHVLQVGGSSSKGADDRSVEVVSPKDMVSSVGSPGIVRDKAFDIEMAALSQSRIAPGNISSWHHHGTRDLLGFMVSGELRLEFGNGGNEAALMKSGDFFHVPVGLIHRDVNPAKVEAVVVAAPIGSGPTVVEVDRPA